MPRDFVLFGIGFVLHAAETGCTGLHGVARGCTPLHARRNAPSDFAWHNCSSRPCHFSGKVLSTRLAQALHVPNCSVGFVLHNRILPESQRTYSDIPRHPLLIITCQRTRARKTTARDLSITGRAEKGWRNLGRASERLIPHRHRIRWAGIHAGIAFDAAFGLDRGFFVCQGNGSIDRAGFDAIAATRAVVLLDLSGHDATSLSE